MGTMKASSILLLSLALSAGAPTLAAQPANAECVVPSKPGGAMDITCKLAQKALQANLQWRRAAARAGARP